MERLLHRTNTGIITLWDILLKHNSSYVRPVLHVFRVEFLECGQDELISTGTVYSTL
jgi:hypothetical protein